MTKRKMKVGKAGKRLEQLRKWIEDYFDGKSTKKLYICWG